MLLDVETADKMENAKLLVVMLVAEAEPILPISEFTFTVGATLNKFDGKAYPEAVL